MMSAEYQGFEGGAGTFPYYCKFHVASGMKGTVTVNRRSSTFRGYSCLGTPHPYRARERSRVCFMARAPCSTSAPIGPATSFGSTSVIHTSRVRP